MDTEAKTQRGTYQKRLYLIDVISLIGEKRSVFKVSSKGSSTFGHI